MSPQDIVDSLQLIALHLAVYCFAAWRTRDRIVTLFHLALIYQVFAFVVRPLISIAADGFTLYSFRQSWDAFEFGLGIQLSFVAVYVITYTYLHAQAPRLSRQPSPLLVVNPLVATLWALAIGSIAVLLIILLSGRAWLPTEREQTLTSVVPYGKLLFPLAVINLSASVPLSYCVWLKSDGWMPKVLAVGCVLVSTVLIALLNQRGFLLFGLLAALVLWEKHRGRIPPLQLLLFGAVAIVWLWTVRPLVNRLLGGETDIAQEAVEGVAESILSRATFDNADVWPVVLDYVREEGYLLGETALAFPARFFPPWLREELGIKTAVDRVNEFYWGDLYWTSNWGFNITLPQEAYINFGLVGAILGVAMGLLTWLVDRWLDLRSRVNALFVFVLTGLFFSGGFLGDPSATVQWVVAYSACGLAILYLSRLRA